MDLVQSNNDTSRNPELELNMSVTRFMQACSDTPGYRFKGKDKLTCEFLTRSNSQKIKQCKKRDPKQNRQLVKVLCRKSCDNCLDTVSPTAAPIDCNKDDKTFRYILKGTPRTCAFFGKNAKRKRIYCKKIVPEDDQEENKTMMKHFCLKTCKYCPISNAPSESPSTNCDQQLKDERTFTYTILGSPKTCFWVGRFALRIKRYCDSIVPEEDQQGDKTVVKHFCLKSCDYCPTVRPTLIPSSISLPPTPTPRKKTTGETCSQKLECLSGVCRNGTCYKSDVCKKIKHAYGSVFDKDKIVVVFVGSGFTDLDAWRAQVTASYSSFDSFKLFDPTNPQFISVYVDTLKPSFCYYNCAGIRRLLCCSVTTAQTLAEKCFPTGTTHQTIVVHNDDEYGGAGYRYQNMATLSINSKGPLVAIHELGHSLFNLGDEYSYNDSSNSASNPNCDTNGCSKWSDLVDNDLAGCTIKACNTGPNRPADYFVGERSFMQYLDSPVGEVNLRFSCCTFLALTGTAPDYCEKYDSGVFNAGHLLKYCKNDYQGYGPVYPTSDSKITLTMQEGTSGKYIYLENSKQLLISKDFEYLGSSSTTDSNLHLRSEIFGDIPHEKLSFFAENGDVIKITVVFSSGERLVQFRKKHMLVHVPFNELEHDSSESDPAKLPFPYLHVVVDGSKGDVIDVIVTDV